MLELKEKSLGKYADKSTYAECNSIVDALALKMDMYSNLMAITDDYNNVSFTYGELKQQIEWFAGGLQSLGVKKGDMISLFSENCGRWIVVDQGILKCGAINAIRGSNAPVDELNYIALHSKSQALVVKDVKTYKKLKPFYNRLNFKFVIIMFVNEPVDREGLNVDVYSYDDIIERGKLNGYSPVEISRDDSCTLIYTSGTTGMLKGAELTNNNYIYQITVCDRGLQAKPGENTLQILPIWHAYERIGIYIYLSKGCHLHFTVLSGFKNDLLKYNIDSMMSVPRIWESVRTGIYQKLSQKSPVVYRLFTAAVNLSIAYKTHKMYSERRITNKISYNALSSLRHKIARVFMKPLHELFTRTLYKKIKNAAGLNFRVSISGGGSLSMQDELFYDAIGVNLRIGYGLTETSPVLTLREVWDKNYLGSAGKPIEGTELKIINPKTGEQCKPFEKGLIIARGPQIMKGYFNDPDSTKKAITDDGWFNTGDLGWLTHEGNLVLVGRLKETIVLSTGENVEPVPIEEACLLSPYIEQIILVGQDRSGIGALIVPSKEAFNECGINLTKDSGESSINDAKLRELIKKEINTNIINKPNLRVFEKVKTFEILKEGFSVENGLLSATLKLKRNKIFEKYEYLISNMFETKI